MCDYSLKNVRSRPAKVGDKLITRNFATGTNGFAEQGGDPNVAICVLPGTELAFAGGQVSCYTSSMFGWSNGPTHRHGTAILRQVNRDVMAAHHDALEFPDGRKVLLTSVCEHQTASVLQLPAKPQTPVEAAEQKRVAYVG